MSAQAARRPRVDAGVVDGWSRALAHRLLGRLHHGRLTVDEGGHRLHFGEPSDVGATLRVLHPSFWRRVMTRGGTGLADAYAAAQWEADDLVAVLRLLARNIDRINRVIRNPVTRARGIAALATRHRRPSAERDRRNIRAHYDAGDDFFALFLDPTMAYSCALFEHPGMSLEEASTAKFERICRLLELTPDSHVVEIGGGWGGFAVHAAQRHGCRVTTTTLSERQYGYMRDRVARHCLGDRVTVLRDHYRDLRGDFTHLVSVEMIEAVDWRLHDEYFATLQRLLRPGGRAVLQAIVVDDGEFERSKHWTDFIKRSVFPGGCLPSVSAMLRSVARTTDLRLVDLLDIGPHYVTTLRLWRETLDGRLDDARALGWDDRRLRLWRFYLAYCEAGFAEGRVSDVQMLLARPGDAAPAGVDNRTVARTMQGSPRETAS